MDSLVLKFHYILMEFAHDLSTLPSLISQVTQIIPPELIYSTPHSAMWRAYCDCFKHTLIISDPQYGANSALLKDPKAFPPGRALVVYSFNAKQRTFPENLSTSGIQFQNMSLIVKHCRQCFQWISLRYVI